MLFWNPQKKKFGKSYLYKSSKKVGGKCSFSTFNAVNPSFCLINFLVTFYAFGNWFWNHSQTLTFLVAFLIFFKTISWDVLLMFWNFVAQRRKMSLWFKFAIRFRFGILYFLKRWKLLFKNSLYMAPSATTRYLCWVYTHDLRGLIPPK